MVTILIAANVIVFIIISVAGFSGCNLSEWLGLSSSFAYMIRRPWTLISYSVAQFNVLQLIFNMLWLYGFGKLFLMRADDRQLLLLYLAGALAGAFLYLITDAITDTSSHGLLLGSSAAVIAIAVAVAVIMPDIEIPLPLLGPTKIKWIVGVVVLIFFIGLSTPNAGGNLAHIGGVAAGIVGARIIVYRKNNIVARSNEYNKLADKIKKSGFDSLSPKERRRFFELSSKNK